MAQTFVDPEEEEVLLKNVSKLLSDFSTEKTLEQRFEWLLNVAGLMDQLKARIAKQRPEIICEGVSYFLDNGVSVQEINEIVLQEPLHLHEDVNNYRFLVTYSNNIQGGLTVFSLDNIPKGTFLGPYVSLSRGTQIWGETYLSIFMALAPSFKDYPIQHNPRPTFLTYRAFYGASHSTKKRKFWTKHRNNPDLLLALNKYSLRRDATGITLKEFILPVLRNCEGWNEQWQGSLNVSYLDHFFDCFSIPVSPQTDIPYKEDDVMRRLSGYICRVNQASGVEGIVQTGQCNVEFCSDPRYSGPCVKTNQPVQKYGEILADYGPEYWKNKHDEAITRNDLVSLVKNKSEAETARMLEFTNFLQETNFSGLVKRNVRKHLITLLRDPRIREDTDSDEEVVVPISSELEEGDILCVLNKTPHSNACSCWPGIVTKINKHWVCLFWVGAIYAGEFKPYYGTENSGAFRKTSFIKKRISHDTHEYNMKNNDWYYLQEEYTHLPKKLGKEEIAAMRKLVQVKKETLGVSMESMAKKECLKNEYVHKLLEEKGADIVSLLDAVCSLNPKQEEEMVADTPTTVLSTNESFIMEEVNSCRPVLKKRKKKDGSCERGSNDSIRKKVRFSMNKHQIKWI